MVNRGVSPSLRGAILVSLLAGAGVHAEVDGLVREAQVLSDSGRAAKAFSLLEPHEVTRAGDPDFDLAFGIAANRSGQFTRAVLALERLLTVQPDNVHGRSELGRALYGVRDLGTARGLLKQSRDEGVPGVPGETIDQLLHAIDRVDAEGRSSYRAYVEGRVGHDSNINGSPRLSSVAVPSAGGTVLPLLPPGLQRDGAFGSTGAGVSGRMVLNSRTSFIGNATAGMQQFTGINSQFDVRQADANGGIAYRVERHEFSAVAQAGIYDIDNRRVRDLYGLVGEWTYRPDGFRQFNTFFQSMRLTYPQASASDSNRTVIGVTYAHLFRSGFWGYAGAYIGEEEPLDAAMQHLGHKVVGLRTGVQHPILPDLAVFAHAGHEERRFGGVDPQFQTTRKDQQTNFSLGVSWVPANSWRVTPQYSYTRTRSTAALAQYDKRTYSVSLRRDF